MSTSSINRVSGMVSGLDTDILVKKLMAAESVGLNKAKQKQQTLTWRSDSYRKWNSDIFTFRSSAVFNMKLDSSYNTYSTTSSNPDSMSGVATADAVDGTFNYQISNLAQSATIKSNIVLDPTAALTNTPTTLTITGTNQSGVPSTATVSVKAGDKIGDVIAAINTAKDASGNSIGLKAVYDTTLKQLIIKTKDTGAKTQISISSSDAGFLDTTLGFSGSQDADNANGFNGNTGAYVTGSSSNSTNPNVAKDAKIKFNGTDVTSSSNTVNIMGVNYTLKNVTTGTNTVTVTRDIDAEVKNIKDFVSKYNDLLDKLNSVISEPVYKDYQPLTDDQRTAMSETQITQWETKAKSGLLNNDSTLKGLVNNLRNHMTSKVDNGSIYNSLSSIGIASQNYTDKGKLYIDETKLRNAIQADPDAIKSLFSQSPSDNTDTKKGMAVKLYDDFKNAISMLVDKAGSSGSIQSDQSYIGKLLTQTSTFITTETDRLNKKESSYYAKFTAMETAMNKYQSQSSYLAQNLSGK